MLQLLVRLFHHDYGRVHHRPDGDGDSSQRHDVRAHADCVHGNEGHDHRDGNRQDRDDGAWDVPQENQNHKADDDQLFDQRVSQGVDRAVNEIRAVVCRHNLDTGWKTGLQVEKLRFHLPDHIPNILPVTDHDGSSRHLTFAIQFRNTPSHFRPEFDTCDVTYPNRCAVVTNSDGKVLNVCKRLDVAASPHHVLFACHLQAAPAHLVVAVADCLHYLRQRNLVGKQAIGIDVHLILLDEPAHRGHLRHARYALQPIAQVPVVEGAHLLEVVLSGLVHQGVLECPADARGVRAKLRGGAFGKFATEFAHVFEHARPAPIDVRAFLENHVDI